MTRREPQGQIDKFFDNMARSTDDEGLPEGQPKPLAADRGQELLLVDVPGWFTAARWQGFFRRYREDLSASSWPGERSGCWCWQRGG